MHRHTQKHTQAHTQAYTHTRTGIHTHKDTWAHIHIRIGVEAHKHVHTHIHTYTVYTCILYLLMYNYVLLFYADLRRNMLQYNLLVHLCIYDMYIIAKFLGNNFAWF